MTNHVRHRGILGLIVSAALFATAGAAQAQEFPSRALTLIYPYSAGSNPDNAFRAIGETLSEKIGQPVVHENRTGAGGRVGLEAALNAQPDGYTIGVYNLSTAVVQPLRDPSRMLEAGKDFTPLRNAIQVDLLLVARADLPFDDMAGLIDFAKANPDALNYATAGTGTGGHLGMVGLADTAGIVLTHIPFQGSAKALQSLISGETELALVDASAKPYVDEGQLKVIGTAGLAQNPVFPDAPLLSDTVPGFSNSAWLGLVAAPGIPQEAADTLVSALDEALQDPDLVKRLEATGWTVINSGPEDFVALIEQERVSYAPIVAAAGE